MTPETEFQDYFSIMSRAQALMDIERWSDAVAILNQGLSANPDNHWILCSLAVSHMNLGDRDRAMGYANRAAGGASLVILAWWGLLWSGHPQGEYAPQTITNWLILIALWATTVTSGALLWLEHRRTSPR